MLLMWREDVYDAIHRLRCVLGVEGAEYEVPGLGGGQRERDCLKVTHLAHQDHVRVLPQDVLQGLGEALGVLVDFALVYDALLVLVVLRLLALSGISHVASSDPSKCARTSKRISLYTWCRSSGPKESSFSGVARS
jgi:hypothetical protein